MNNKLLHTRIMKKGMIIISLFILFSCNNDDGPTFIPRPEPVGDAKVNINGAKKKHIISPMIQGHGLSYSVESDYIYEDGILARVYQDVGAGFLRSKSFSSRPISTNNLPSISLASSRLLVVRVTLRPIDLKTTL